MKLSTYDIAPSFLGHILMAKENNHVCALFLNDDKLKLMEELEHKFPTYALNRDPEIQYEIEQILQHLNSHQKLPHFTYQFYGTPFQKEVWNYLLTIPSGETVSYSDIALHLNRPKSVRAVANACGANHIAILIPCHRVIGKNGKLTGYRWGLKIKEFLLKQEKNI